VSIRLAQPSTRPRAIPADAVVLGDRPLRPGVARSATSRFRDTVWDLSPAIHHLHGRKLGLTSGSASFCATRRAGSALSLRPCSRP